MKKNEKLEGVHIELAEVKPNEFGMACDLCLFKCNNKLCEKYNNKCTGINAFVLVED